MATVGGVPTSYFTSSDPAVQALAQQLLREMQNGIGNALAPACTASYNGCR